MAYKPAHKFIAILFATLILTMTSISGLQIKPALAQTADFKFAATADWGCGETDAEAVSDFIDAQTNSATDFVLSMGDLSYDSDGSDNNCYWEDLTNEIDNINKIAIGNHDDDDSPEIEDWVDHYNNNYGQINENGGAGYYDFTHQNVRTIVLNTELSYGSGSTQYNWLVSALADANANPNIDWTIVMFHRVMYTSDNTEHQPETNLYTDIAELLDNEGVDLVLQGHNHFYSRTHQVNADGTTSPTVVDSSSPYLEDNGGFVSAVVGTAGAGGYDITGTPSYIADDEENSVDGALICEVFGSTSLECDFKNTSNSVLDSFEITGVGGSNGGHHYDPYGFYDGVDDFGVQADATNLDLNTFTVQTWFKTASNFTSNVQMVNKGGQGSDTTGENMNYGIWMTNAEKVACGFETNTGANNDVVSPLSYADGEWHLASCTYGGSTVRLYVDGAQVATFSTGGATPETNAKDLVVGKNSRANDAYYQQDLDEISVWNRGLSATEIADYFNSGTAISSTGQVYSNNYPDPSLF